MQTKGQAAMEFLMTYGWAILAAVIAIAVLAYFGVFSPGSYAPTICVLSAPLGCDVDSIVLTDGGAGADTVGIYIANGAGETVTIDEIWVKGCQTASADIADVDIANGQESASAITATCDNPTDAFASGDSFSSDIVITYQKGSGTRDLTSSGRISKAA